nr:murein L,D-transpeptidase catalytic domain family protein [Chitinophagaceae bacterium]
DYVSKSFAMGNKRIGRSHGCPALPRALNEPIINKIKNGHCLYIYHPTKTYFANSRWIKDPLKYLPKEAELLDLNPKIVAYNDKKLQAEDKEKDLKIDADDEINEKDLPKEVIETAKVENVIVDKPVFEMSEAQMKNSTIIKISKDEVEKLNANGMTIYKTKVPEAPKTNTNIKSIIQISNNGSQADTLKIK